MKVNPQYMEWRRKMEGEKERIMSKANERQVGGGHYQKQRIQHWDVVAANDLDYFQGQITKYVMRWKDKNGLQDLEKAKHFLDKYIEVEQRKLDDAADENETKQRVESWLGKVSP